MCNKKALDCDNAQLAARYQRAFKNGMPDPSAHRYLENAFNHDRSAVITSGEPEFLQSAHWGLIPSWCRDRSAALVIRDRTINARSETMLELPSFRVPARRQRCLVPATGFYEYMQGPAQKKYPFYIFLPGERIFSFAGLWDQWTDRTTGEILQTYTILTVPANGMMSRIHNSGKRMPLILPREREEAWIRQDLSTDDIQSFCCSYPEEKMTAHTISRLISSRKDDPDQPAVQQPYPYPELEGIVQDPPAGSAPGSLPV
ncbi:MAG: SOS response-associated peptidase [Chitinophagaceae bacterium]